MAQVERRWNLKWVVLKPPQPPPSRDIHELIPSLLRNTFRGHLDEQSKAETLEALMAGWEPFDSTTLEGGNVLLWFRSSTLSEPEVVEAEDAPGQYL